MFRTALPILLCAGLSGCLSHMAAREDSGSLNIRWQQEFGTASRAARASGRLILLVMVAGEFRDKC